MRFKNYFLKEHPIELSVQNVSLSARKKRKIKFHINKWIKNINDTIYHYGAPIVSVEFAKTDNLIQCSVDISYKYRTYTSQAFGKSAMMAFFAALEFLKSTDAPPSTSNNRIYPIRILQNAS